jgi:hypothetical protein
MSKLDKGGSFDFPDVNLPDSKKDKEYHKNFVLAIANKAFNGYYDLEYRAIEECQNFFNGTQSGDEYSFLQDAPDGSSLPAKWINFNKIRAKINILVGEIIRKGYRVKVSSVNKEAKSRKLQAREDARVDLRLQPTAGELEEEIGIPLMKEKKFEDEQELEDFYNYNYKEKSEIIMKSIIDFCLKRGRWGYERISSFRDVAITARAFVKVELINGIPKARRIDPKLIVWDKEASDDFLSDATFWGEIRYMNLADAASKYDISKEQLIKIYNQYSKNVTDSRNRSSSYRAFNDSSIELFKQEDNSIRVMVLEACWIDYKKFVNKISVDKYGTEHVKTLSDETKESKDIVSKNYKIWRKGVLLGGEILVDWGELKNQPRSIDDFSETGAPYFACIPNYINKQAISIVEQLKGLQDLKNITMYNIQLAMSRAGAKGFVYDVAQLPEGWDIESVMKYLNIAGLAFIDSAKDEMPASFNQFQQFDMTLSNSVSQYIEISSMIDRYMDEVSGINEARQGIIQSSSQAVGVTKMASVQSSLTTESMFTVFKQFSENIYNYIAGLAKIAWVDKERFSPVIGDAGIDFLKNDVDLALDDYAVFIEDVPEGINDPQMLNQMIMGAVQSGALDFVQAIKLLNSSDIDYAIRTMERYMMEKERKEMQAAEADRQAQAENQQAQAQAMQQMKSMEAEQAMNTINLTKQKEGENELRKIASKGKIDLVKQSMKEKGDSDRLNSTNANKIFEQMGKTQEE